jgi:hypothetical protein
MTVIGLEKRRDEILGRLTRRIIGTTEVVARPQWTAQAAADM